MRRLIPSLLILVPTVMTSAADSVHEAGALQKFDADLKGSGTAKTPYRDVAPDGGVLVGLDVGLGGSPPAERVTAIRPVFRVEGKNRAGSPAGHFLSDEVTRTVRLMAHDGYAVAGIRVSAGKRIDGLAVCFARADGSVLNPADAYESAWVGNANAEGRELVDGQGRPVLGLFGRIDGDVLVGLGLTFAELPVSSAPAPAPVTVGTLAIQPEPPAGAATSFGNLVPALIVFAVVAVSIGLIGVVIARRRRSCGVQKLPPAAKSFPDINLHMTRPPSIPTDLLLPGTRPPAASRKPSTDAMIALDIDAFRH